MCCLECIKNIVPGEFYNFNYPLEEIVIMKNNKINKQPVFEKNTYLYKKYNDKDNCKMCNKTIPKIIIEDSDEEIIYDINNDIINKYNFKEDLERILSNRIKVIKNNNMKYKQEVIEHFLENNINEIKFENITNNIRNRKNKIEVIEEEEWNIVE